MSKSITFQFEAYLSREKINENELSLGLKKKIKEIKIVQTSIPELKRDAAVDGLSDKKKAQLENRILEYEAALPGLDEEILSGIKRWQKNRERYAEAGKRLNAAHAAKRSAGAPEPVQTPAPEPVAEPPATPPAEPPAPANEPSAAPAAPENKEESKKMGPLGWGLIVIGALVLGVGGVALARRASERSGS